MIAIWISVLFLALVKNAAPDYNPAICPILEDSRGLIPPPLPKNFEMKAEHVDHLQNFSAYEEIYFDYTNSRAKYMQLLDTIEFHYLFDYDTQQVVEWQKIHPGVSMKRDPLSHNCKAVNMEASKYSYLFGYDDWIYLRPKMFNSNQVLRYGGQYLYAANGTLKLDERGLQVNMFIGCLYDDSLNTTMSNQYYFADTKKVQPSGGTPSTIVTGAYDKPLSVPVMLNISGGISVGNDVIKFEKTISISWFKGNPEFQPETFQIPPWIYCDNYRGRKDEPKLPTAFSTRLVRNWFVVDMLGTLVPKASGESYEEIYYDQGRNLARRDFTPNQDMDSDIYSKFGSYTPVSTIYDFNEGLRYTINKNSGRCYIAPIMDNEFFDTEEELIYRKLGTPEEIFLMQMDDMEYKGKAFARDVECDVWNGKHYHEKFDKEFVKETYFSTDGWHENTDGNVERRVPVKHMLITKELDADVSEGISTYNFLKFRNRAPKLDSFNIKNCVELINHKRFAIQLMLNDENSKLVFKYEFFFLEAAQLFIANKTEVNTPLRVQRLRLRHQSANSNRVFLIFSLLDKAIMSAGVGQKGKTLEEAIILLQRLVEAGKFSVQFNDPQTNEAITVLAERGSLYSLTAGGNLTPAPPNSERMRDSQKDEVPVQVHVEEHEGMTGGHLALLAVAMLVIGIGIGIALMYLYLRIYSEHHVDDRIHMSETASSVAAADGVVEHGP